MIPHIDSDEYAERVSTDVLEVASPALGLPFLSLDYQTWDHGDCQCISWQTTGHREDMTCNLLDEAQKLKPRCMEP
jgi:hypothetical protein